MIIEEVEIKKDFEPFVVKITVETEEELFDLYHRFNCNNHDDYFKRNDQFGIANLQTQGVHRVFCFINNKINSMNLTSKLLGE